MISGSFKSQAAMNFTGDKVEVTEAGDTAVELEWREFLRNQYNLFFDNSFYSYNNIFGKNIEYVPLKFRDKKTGKIVAIMLGNMKHIDGRKTYSSSDGVSFAGFLWKKRSDLLNFLDVIGGFKSYLKLNGYEKCIIKAPPFLYDRMPNQESEYAMLVSGFRVSGFSISNIIDLKEFEFKKISETKKRSIKKSQNNITVSIVEGELTKDNFSEYYSILRNNRELKNVSPTHSMEELMYLKNKLPESIVLFQAHVRSDLAAICVLFVINEDMILNFYLAGSEEFMPDGVSEYILYQSVEWSRQNGYRYYDIGTSDTGKGLIEGLFAFKKKFLANGFLRKTYELNINAE